VDKPAPFPVALPQQQRCSALAIRGTSCHHPLRDELFIVFCLVCIGAQYRFDISGGWTVYPKAPSTSTSASSQQPDNAKNKN
jgi:hypothetical protein